MNMPDLAMVIVNWNTRDLLRDCLTSVYANRGVTFQVCVVDNASTDGSPEMVEREFPQVRLIRNPRNSGFAHANNLGLRIGVLESLAIPILHAMRCFSIPIPSPRRMRWRDGQRFWIRTPKPEWLAPSLFVSTARSTWRAAAAFPRRPCPFTIFSD